MLPSGAHRRPGRTALVVLQLIVFVTYLFGPTSALAEDPTPEPTPTESSTPEATPEPTPEPTPLPTEPPMLEPAAEPAVEPTQAPAVDPTPEATPAPSATPAGEPSPYLITFAPGTSDARQLEILSAAGATDVEAIPQLALRSILLDATSFSDQLVTLRATADVMRVEADRIRDVEAAPTDSSYADQWSLPHIGWAELHGSVSIAGSATVAVLDTGVDASHPDLDGVVLPGWSALAGVDPQTDPNGHGTWMAGIVAAETDNAFGVAGTAYAGVSVLPISVLGADGTGQDSDIIAGVVHAADADADVILMAFSNPGFSAALQAAIDYAWDSGSVLVAATGNDGVSSATFPAGDRGVIGVTSTDATDALAASANHGPAAFMAAPGVDIQTTTSFDPATTQPGDEVVSISGTSAAAAVVAGAAALLFANEPELSNGVVVSRLARTTDAAGDPADTGNGRLNLHRAMADTSLDELQPAGAAPVGNGGPLVGPYIVAAPQAAFDVAPNHLPSTGTTVVSVLVRNTQNGNGNAARCARVTLPASVDILSFTFTVNATSGTWAASPVTAANYAEVRTTTQVVGSSPNGLIGSSTRDWVRFEITAVSSAAATETWTASIADDIIQADCNDSSALLGVSVAQDLPREYTADFRDASGGVIAAPPVTGGGTQTYRVRITRTAGTDDLSAAAVAAPTCLSGLTNPAAVTDSGPPSGWAANATDNVYRLTTGGNKLAANGQWVQIQFTATAGCSGPEPFRFSAWKGTTPATGQGDIFERSIPDATAPTVTSINRDGASPTNATSVSWTVTFSESVNNVDAADFVLAASGLSGTSITGVSGSGTTRTVTASTGTGDGTLGLNLADNDTITDAAGNPLGGTGAGNGNFTGQVYAIDKTAPTVTSINRDGASPTNATSVSWTVTFSESVNNVDAADFVLAASGLSGTSITGVSGSGTTRTVTASTGTGDGTLGLNLADNDTITDAAGNPLGGTGAGNGNFTGQVYAIDKTAPTVTSINRDGASPTNATSVSWTVTFSESVNNVDAADFVLAASGLSGTSITGVSGSGTTRTVTASTGTGDGTLGLNLADNDTITDAAGNPLGGTGAGNGNFTGQVYAIDKTAPTVTIDQATGQEDPTNASPINFTVVFSEPVTGFTAGDLILSGSAGATTALVTGGGMTYNVAVSGMTSDGTVNATIGSAAASDAAGNGNAASTSTDHTVTYDATPPTVTINQDGLQDDPTNVSPVAFDVVFSEPVSGFDWADVDVSASTAGTGLVTVTDSGDSMIFTVTVQSTSPDGLVIATIPAGGPSDAAGNSNTASTSTDNMVTYDTTAPTSEINFPIDGNSYNAAAWTDAITGTAADAVDVDFVEVSILRDGDSTYWDGDSWETGETFILASGTTSWSYAFADANLTDGESYTVRSRATDTASNVQDPLDSAGFSYDTTVPVATIDLQAGSDSGASASDDITNALTLTFDVTFTESVSGLTAADFSNAGTAPDCVIGEPVGSGDTYTVTVTDCDDGTVVLQLAASAVTDTAGNPNAQTDGATVVVDRTDPAVSEPDLDSLSDSGASQADNLTNDTNPDFSGTAEANAFVELLRDGSVVASGFADGFGDWSLIDPNATPDDTYTYTARATDAAGNTSDASTGLDVTIDTLDPAVSEPDLDSLSDSGASQADNLTNDTNPDFSGTAEANAFVELLRDGSVVASGFADGFGDWSLIDPNATPDDTYTYTARATDAAGNTSDASTGLDVTIDTLDPAVSEPDLDSLSDSGASQADNLTNDTNPDFSGTAEANAFVELLRDGSVVASGFADGFGDWSLIDPNATPDDTYTYTARATDAAGNTSDASTGLDVTIDTLDPTVSIDLQAASDSGISSTDDATNAATLVFDVTFSEDVSGVAAADFSLAGTAASGCSVDPVTALTDSTYELTVSGCGEGTVTATFAADGAADTAGNTGPTAATDGPEVLIDRTAPTATIDLQPGSDSGASATDNLTKALSLTFDVDFDEDVFDLAASDFSVGGSATGCSVGAPIGSGDSYDVTLSGCSEGTVILTLAASGVTDTAGNANAVTSGPTVTVDRTGPSVVIDLQAASDSGISSTDDATNAATLVFDVTFSEDVSGVAAADFSLAGTAASGCSVDPVTALTDSTYELTVSGCGEGTVTATFAADGAADTAGNTGPTAATDGPEVLIDRTAPTATIDLQPGSDSGASATDNLTKALSLTFDVDFDEDVFDLAASDFSVGGSATGCSVGAPIGSGDSYDVTLSGCSEGTVILTLAASGVTDTAGNANAVTSGPTVTVDRTGPSVVIDLQAASDSGISSTDDATNAATLVFDVTFSEDVSGVAAADFSLAGTAASGCSVDPVTALTDSTYELTVSGCGEGTVTATFAADGAADTAGNTGPTAATDGPEVLIDRTAPTATIDLQPGSDSGASATDNLTKALSLTFDVDFDEDVFDLAASDFSVGGSATGCSVGAPIGSGDSYDVTLSGCSEGTVILTLAASGVTDTAGNANAVTSGPTVTVDRTGPSVVIDLQAASDSGISSTDDATNAATLVFDVTFSEDVSGVAAADFSLAGTAASGCSVDPVTALTDSTYELTVSGCGEGTVTATFAADGAADTAGNTGPTAATDGPEVLIDRTAPTATIDLQPGSDSGASATDNLTKALSLTFDVDFDEDVFDLAASDFSVGGSATGCSVGAPIGSGDSYDVTLSGCSEGTVILTLAASGVTDTAGNANAVTSGPTVTVDRTAPAVGTPDLDAGSDSGDSSTDSLTNDNTPTFIGTAEAGSDVTIYVDSVAKDSGPATGGSYSITTSTLTDGTRVIAAKATDAAGNTSGFSGTLSIKIDTANPDSSITFPAHLGSYDALTWNAGCTVAFIGDACGMASDSGLATVSAVHIALRNAAGMYWTGTGSSFTSPTPVWLSTPGTTGWNKLIPYSTFPTAGSYTLLSRSTDTAGNVETAPDSHTFSVSNVSGGVYVFEGFFQPIDNTNLNKANAGSTIPVKWRITLNGVPASDPNSFVALTSRVVDCGTLSGMAPDNIETYTTNSGLQYTGNGSWHFNWKTPKSYANQCRIMTLTLNDGSIHDADFKFK